MTLTHSLLVTTFKRLLFILCKIDNTQLGKVPEKGPLIIVGNHVNLLEIPILYTHLQPRPVTGLVHAQRWESFPTRWLLNTCHAIPLHRGEANIVAFKQSLEALKKGRIVIIMPEGTRSESGILQKAHPGVILLALRSQAPILPVAYYGGENFHQNLRSLRRTDFIIKVGEPFFLDDKGVKPTKLVRRQMIDEVMYTLSALLPEKYRGVYSDVENATSRFISPIQ